MGPLEVTIVSLAWAIVPSTASFSGYLLRGRLNHFFLSAGITRFTEASSSKYIRFDYAGGIKLVC